VRTVATCAAERAVVGRLLDLFDAVLHVSAAGELEDVWLGVGAGVPTLEAALLLAERKTAEYSFALPLQAAAVLAGAGAVTVAAAGEVGRSLGTAYQLLDDLQGVYGDPGVTGKSRLSDLRSGKQTALVAHARTTAAWPTVAPYVGLATLTEQEAAVVRDLLVASGSRGHVEALARAYVDRAVTLARGAGLPVTLVSWLARLGGDLLRSLA
jgi:geranylgeranyl diphosphate synthase, type II